MEVKTGTLWWGGDKKFRVIAVVKDDDNNTWVHYREDRGDPPKEYSCFMESFTVRFTPLPD